MRPRTLAERQAALDALRRELAARFGAHVLLRWEQAQPQRAARALPTGSLALDLASGIGGLPRGRLSELAGPPYAGKRTLAAHAVAQAQRGRGWAAYLDGAQSLDPDRWRALGVDLADLLWALPRSLPEALAMAQLLLRTRALDLIVLDLRPGWAGRLLARGVRRLRPLARRAPTALLVVRDLLPSEPDAGLGGAALRLRLVPDEELWLGSARAGLRVRPLVQARGQAEPVAVPVALELDERAGLRRAAELFDLACWLGVVVRHPLGFLGAGTVLGRSRSAALARLEAEPALWARVEEEVRARGLSPVERPVAGAGR
ncbi:DNA recombination/repair protein RecA [Thermomicrobiaceae bacterium CFH 74404]|uniref:Protein RecA n=1 Tax=Thermalbibacter longus TaxID=2951981 RepID=A0AA42BBP9_9BACT|nr:recombinase A [Thermalbibacter longus]MCM8748023.1 DNA recombination/repair protein RecA [Thermalbibacter longus]